MRSDALVMIEYFYSILSGPDVNCFSKMLEGYGVKVFLVSDVRVRLYLGHRPFGQLKVLFRKREQVVFSSARKASHLLMFFPVKGAELIFSRVFATASFSSGKL